MAEPQIIAVAERTATLTHWISSLTQAASVGFGRAGAWATRTALTFGSVVSALMGPAIVSVYVMALWSLTANIGWTGAFMVTSGPLSNWMVWLGIALLLHGAASILKRRGERS